MENQKDSTDKVEPPSPASDNAVESNKPNDSHLSVDPVKLLSDTQSFLKSMGSKSVEAFGLPNFSLNTSDSGSKTADGKAKPAVDAFKPSGDKSEAKTESKNESAETIVVRVQPASPKQIQFDNPKSAVEAPKPQVKPADKVAEKPADKVAEKPVLDSQQQEIADKLIGKITDSTNPVQDIKKALAKLDNLRDATVTMNGKSSHIDINLMHSKNVAAPNITVKGFTPVQSHLSSHLSFDLTPHKGGFSVSNMDGFSGTVQGPLGRLRHSDTTGMFIGKDQYGGYINTTSDLHMRRKIHTSTTTLREQHLEGNSPLKALMQKPESLEKVGSLLRMFQSTEDVTKMGIKRNGANFDVSSEAKDASHVELNFTPKPDEKALIKIPITVKSLDMEKGLSASLSQEKDSVTLGNIKGLIVNIEIAKMKTAVAPTKVSIENDKVNLELTNPEDGSTMPVSIPIAKLKEAAAKLKH